MPMVAAQEEQDRKKHEEEEAEKNLAALKEEEITVRSIERVHEHFKNVAKTANISSEMPSVSRKQKIQIPLGQMHGRKRKRQSDVDISMDRPEDFNYDVLTPKPTLDLTLRHQSYAKKRNNEITDYSGSCKEMKNDHAPARSTPKNNFHKLEKKNKKNEILVKNETRDQQDKIKRLDAFASVPQKKKDQKMANIKELKQKGMLPQQNFDYKTVDFSSFQGGSKIVDVSKSTQFQQQKQKDKIKKGKKRKKQKISGI